MLKFKILKLKSYRKHIDIYYMLYIYVVLRGVYVYMYTHTNACSGPLRQWLALELRSARPLPSWPFTSAFSRAMPWPWNLRGVEVRDLVWSDRRKISIPIAMSISICLSVYVSIIPCIIKTCLLYTCHIYIFISTCIHIHIHTYLSA